MEMSLLYIWAINIAKSRKSESYIYSATSNWIYKNYNKKKKDGENVWNSQEMID